MTKSNRESLGERTLRAPLLSFSINNEIEKLLKEPGWLTNDRNAVTLQKNPKLRVVLISLRKGAVLHEHKVEGPITIMVLSGNINFIVGEEKVNTKANGMIVLERAIPHDVEALEDSTFILTIIQP